ncbi:hypothetical protein SCHPADRAFT_906092 [Schizopora paradoxa]|uniref:F-box domain-containing protein n=1 Tax=Schizopora paradoxa TaxID=27342 RepID=A0A0H2RPG0_9AGAM|nr:hypothetical protein SCHPADRAFT_906092 [Schizopora paradoxa]
MKHLPLQSILLVLSFLHWNLKEMPCHRSWWRVSQVSQQLPNVYVFDSLDIEVKQRGHRRHYTDFEEREGAFMNFLISANCETLALHNLLEYRLFSLTLR